MSEVSADKSYVLFENTKEKETLSSGYSPFFKYFLKFLVDLPIITSTNSERGSTV